MGEVVPFPIANPGCTTRVEAHAGAICTVFKNSNDEEIELWESTEEARQLNAIRAQMIETARQLAETAEEE